ncbi:hypothetical protein SAMN04487946_11291 [Halobellus clavatus]|jgi:hypothetical protein|uniref:DUF7511 domain-containing protein n=2 Tax=Halobellus clavatus TaxID=660517 RepID=A0A1H3JB11_9EURY|nr:hypothetical protein SAMN04487946_11291 [Halobellus clavatus]
MIKTMSTNSHLPDPATPDDQTDTPTDRRCVARIEEYDDAPDECTLYPADATPSELPTTWISAKEGSYVSLDEMR